MCGGGDGNRTSRSLSLPENNTFPAVVSQQASVLSVGLCRLVRESRGSCHHLFTGHLQPSPTCESERKHVLDNEPRSPLPCPSIPEVPPIGQLWLHPGVRGRGRAIWSHEAAFGKALGRHKGPRAAWEAPHSSSCRNDPQPPARQGCRSTCRGPSTAWSPVLPIPSAVAPKAVGGAE